MIPMADSYDPYWTAVSPFTPRQNGGGSAICTEEMKTYFSSLLNKKVIGVQSDLAGHGVFNVVSPVFFLSLIYSLMFRYTISFSATLGHLLSHASVTISR